MMTKRVPRTGLEPARLAAHAPETCASTNSATWAFYDSAPLPNLSFCFNMLSGKRDSDPRPQPWQGCALPTELFPLVFPSESHWFGASQRASLSIADAKVLLFLELPKLFSRFFQKNIVFCTFCTTKDHYTLLYI